jgi:hypothetical protein
VRGSAFIVLPAVLTALLSPSADAQPASAEFLLIEQPGALRIYDRFEQFVPDPGALGLSAFAAVQVTADRSTLGDEITPVMQVRVNGQTHFLIRDPETGGLVGENSVGAVTRVKNARAVWDTVEILADRGVSFTPASGGRQRTLAAGARVYRIFVAGGRTYVRTVDAAAEHGWLNGGPEADGRLWRRPASTDREAPSDEPPIAARIAERVEETNALMARIYAAVGREASLRLQPPRWNVSTAGPLIRCTLTPMPADSARGSTVLLGKHLESLTFGTRYRVRTSPGSIEVRP